MEKETVLPILKRIKPNVDFEAKKRLLDDGILDSFDVVMLVSEFNKNFQIDIPVEELSSKNLNTLESITALLERLMHKE